MPDFMIEFFKFVQNPNLPALATIAGLAGFLKLIVVPLIKWTADKLNKPISGSATVIAAFVASLLIAEAVGWITHGAMSLTIAIEMLYVSIMASLSALGIQSTVTAAIRPKEA